jgi:NDP-sugar pyrophosphorylase family protein
VTDGDARRAILAGKSLADLVDSCATRDFEAVPPETPRSAVLDLMQARSLRHIPIVDSSGRLLGLHLLSQLIGRDRKPSWAVIMAGGKGTRLRPLTENIPKPMVKVAGRPILERLVLSLVSHGFERIFLAVNYLAEIIEEHFRDGRRFGCRIEYLRENEPLGSGGALSLLPDSPEHPVLVLNGDLVVQADFTRMLDYHRQGGYYATLAAKTYSHRVPYGCLRREGGRLCGLEEKPVLDKLINAGIYLLSPDAVRAVPSEFFPITEIFSDALQNQRPCGVFEIGDDWSDVGQPADYLAANGVL